MFWCPAEDRTTPVLHGLGQPFAHRRSGHPTGSDAHGARCYGGSHHVSELNLLMVKRCRVMPLEVVDVFVHFLALATLALVWRILIDHGCGFFSTWLWENPRFSTWDFGGQSVFHNLHHLFLSRYSVYLVVFKMPAILKDPNSAVEMIRYWLNSLQLHAKGAPILLVGTHKDQVGA